MLPHILLYGTPRQFPNYEAALVRAGAVVRYVGCGGEDWDGLVLPGGGDLNPARYGAALENCRNVDEHRDEEELALVSRFIAWRRPVLGICRGLQVLNVALGGTLLQHVEGHGMVNGADGIHATCTEEGSFLEEIYGGCFAVNTAHHQALGRLGKGLQAVQWAADGVVEAVEHEELPVWGVQWHPERLLEGGKKWDTVDGGRLFSWFLSQCGEA